MPDLSEAWDVHDDWTGITNTTERKRRQNRLAQRLYRRRKHLEKFTVRVSNTSGERSSATSEVTGDSTLKGVTEEPPIVVRARQTQPDVVNYADGLLLVLCPQNREKATEFVQRFFADFRLQIPGDLSLTVHINVLSAWCHNALVLSIPFDELYNDDGISPFNSRRLTPQRAGAPTPSFPVDLCPTEVQRTIVHHPWVDLIPVPRMRDNILRGLEAGLFEEDELCRELAGADNTDDAMQMSFLVWGESWDVKNWELGAGFIQRWGFLVHGCPEILEATNIWREKRGESKIEITEDMRSRIVDVTETESSIH
ncbi:hypothetical protein TWF481_009967 [Arthrobotrys musiformis]|uniref:BZIP domain-containing protein n=1 Tax=Arthrobotrys musiformis TaxID=47236 RepID=A0AAV9W5C5_9PEZI